MSDIWHKLIHHALHAAAHAYHHHNHEKHRREQTDRERAHRLSDFAGVMYDLCKQAGFEIQTLEAEFAAYEFEERVICIGFEAGRLTCYAATPFKFFTRPPREVDQFLENRSSSLQYGDWNLERHSAHYTAMLQIAINPEAFDQELFLFVTQYAHEERAEVEQMLYQAGYKPS